MIPKADPGRGGLVGASRPWSDRAVAAAVFCGVLVIYLLRVPSVVWSTFYAEDGRTFLGDWLSREGDIGRSGGRAFEVLFRPYAGYQHLLPRVISFLVRYLMPVHWWPMAMTVLAALTVAAVCALVYRLTAGLVAFAPARLLLAALPVLTPLAGLEGIGDIANVHWYLLYLTPWCLLSSPRTRGGRVGLLLVTAVAVASEIQAVILLPLALLRLAPSVRTRRLAPEGWAAIGWGIGAAGQVLTYLTAGPDGRQRDLHDLASAVQGYSWNAVMSSMTTGGIREQIVSSVGWGIPLLLTALVFAMAVASAVVGGPTVRLLAVTMLAGSIVSWSLGYFLNDHSAFVYQRMDPATTVLPLIRWGTAAAMLVAAIVPLAADVLLTRRPRWRRWVAGALVLLVVVMSVVDVGERIGARAAVPDWDGQLKVAQARCAQGRIGTAEIPTNPGDWFVPLPCALVN